MLNLQDLKVKVLKPMETEDGTKIRYFEFISDGDKDYSDINALDQQIINDYLLKNCPNLSGEYSFNGKGINTSLIITQKS